MKRLPLVLYALLLLLGTLLVSSLGQHPSLAQAQLSTAVQRGIEQMFNRAGRLIMAPILAGNGTATFRVGGAIYWEYTNTANAADTLYVSTTPFSLPANTLATNGDRLDVYFTAALDATASTKTLICNIGYSAFDTTAGFTAGLSFISFSTTATSSSYVIKAEVTRLSATSDLHNALAVVGASMQASGVVPGAAVTWSNSNNILCIAKSSVGTAGIVTLRDLRVTWSPYR